MNYLLEKLERTHEDMKNFVNSATDKNGNIPSELECLICKFTLYDPRRCLNEDCDQFYCKICLDKQMNIKKECSNCRQSNKGFSKLARMHRLLINQKIVMCSKCGQEITYEKLVLEHTASCIIKQVQCPLGCKTILTSQSKFDHHLQNCTGALK